MILPAATGQTVHPVPGCGERLVVNSLPVRVASFAVVQVVSQNAVFFFGLLPQEQHWSVCVSDGHHRVGGSWHRWWESHKKSIKLWKQKLLHENPPWCRTQSLKYDQEMRRFDQIKPVIPLDIVLQLICSVSRTIKNVIKLSFYF